MPTHHARSHPLGTNALGTCAPGRASILLRCRSRRDRSPIENGRKRSPSKERIGRIASRRTLERAGPRSRALRLSLSLERRFDVVWTTSSYIVRERPSSCGNLSDTCVRTCRFRSHAFLSFLAIWDGLLGSVGTFHLPLVRDREMERRRELASKRTSFFASCIVKEEGDAMIRRGARNAHATDRSSVLLPSVLPRNDLPSKETWRCREKDAFLRNQRRSLSLSCSTFPFLSNVASFTSVAMHPSTSFRDEEMVLVDLHSGIRREGRPRARLEASRLLFFYPRTSGRGILSKGSFDPNSLSSCRPLQEGNDTRPSYASIRTWLRNEAHATCPTRTDCGGGIVHCAHGSRRMEGVGNRKGPSHVLRTREG